MHYTVCFEREICDSRKRELLVKTTFMSCFTNLLFGRVTSRVTADQPATVRHGEH